MMMKKSILIVFILMAVIALTGCTGEKSETTTMSADDGSTKVTTTTSGDTYTMTTEETTEEGTQTTTITGTAGANADSWCPEGGNWEMTSSGVQGEGMVSAKVVKLETTGKYAGLCHVVVTTQGPDGTMNVDYWYDETGEHGYMEMDMNGQKFTQQF